jgi:hypothetical protein
LVSEAAPMKRFRIDSHRNTLGQAATTLRISAQSEQSVRTGLVEAVRSHQVDACPICAIVTEETKGGES